MNYFKRLLIYSKRYHGLNILGLALSLGWVVVGLITPYLTGMIVDDVLQARNFGRLAPLALVYFGITFIRSAMEYAKLYIFEYTSQRVLYDMRSDLYGRLQSQSFSFFDRERTGTLMNRMVGDLQSIRRFLNVGYVQVFEGVLVLATTLPVMVFFNGKLTLVLLLIVPMLYFSTRAMATKLRPVFQRIRQASEDLSSAVQENITGIRVVKAFGQEEVEKERFSEVASKFTDTNIEAADVRSKFVPMGALINGLGQVAILLFGGYLVIKGELTIGALVAFNGYMATLQMPINNANNLVNQWENAFASLEKVFELMDQEPVIQSPPEAIVLKECRGDVQFRNVTFRYGEQDVLHNINLHMRPGTTTAIMGDTGSGKSTIISLIARFYDCAQGQVLVDGRDVREYDYNSLRRQIGIVMQETFLFSDTIAANIAFGRPEATREEIEKVARMAKAHDFIMEMDQGYDTVVGERGVGLSGGQRQRIAIARALLCNPAILVLDDSTSSVDMETEHEIQMALKEIMKDRTTIVIAHRISSVKDADNIIVLDNGRIIEEGTHEELVALKGKYYRTLVEQYSEYGEELEKIIGDDGLPMVVGGH